MRITRPMAVRMLADVLLVNGAFITVLVFRLMFVLFGDYLNPGTNPADTYQRWLGDSLLHYRNYAVLLTALCVGIFYASGFYTYGRTYRSRYKLLVVLQAVTIAFLALGSLAYLFGFRPFFPRTVLFGGWLVTFIYVGGARLAAQLMTNLGVFEHEASSGSRPIRKALVIGGAGYVGSILVRKLLRKGYDVRVLDNFYYGDQPLQSIKGDPHLEIVKGDFRNVEVVVRAVHGMDAVVHLGAIVGDPAAALDGDVTVEINTLAARMVAEVSRGSGVQRFVFASTCSVYGASSELLDEKSSLSPVTLYAKTKIDSEKAILSLAGGNFAPVVLRLATLYGPSPRPRFDLVVNLLTAKAFQDGQITVFGGDQWRPFLHVEDAAEAFVRCLQAPKANIAGQVFNVGANKENYRIGQVGDIIKELVPSASLVVQDVADPKNYRVSFDKIGRSLNFLPKKTVRDGVLEIKESLEKGELDSYQAAIYSNYAYLKGEVELQSVGAASPLALMKEPPGKG